jgi:hypothetical protein
MPVRQVIAMAAPEWADDAMTADGFDAAIIGYGTQFNKPVVVYSRDRVISILMADGMTEDEAEEFFEFNIAGAYVGETTPVYLREVAHV